MSGLRVRDLYVDFSTLTGPVRACGGVSFDIAPGTRLGLVGESGSGKTTTALALVGMLAKTGRVTKGSAVLGDTDLLLLSKEDHRAMRLKQVSYMPQAAMNSLNPVLRVGDQILHGLVDHGQRFSPEEASKRVTELLDAVDLSADVARYYPHELSGGMKQRICLAISISLSPALVIADEPTSALDVVTQRRVMATLDRMQRRINCSLILISHDMGLMAQFVDQLEVMRNGKIVESGSVDQVFRNPQHSYTKALIAAVGNERPEQVSMPGPGNDRVTGASQAVPEAPLLQLENITKSFDKGKLTAVHPFSMTLDGSRPLIVAVVGQSGSGKSTLGSLVLGLQAPTSGTLRFLGKDISHLKGREKFNFRREMQAVFQDPYSTFNPFFRVSRTLTLPARRFGIVQGKAEADRLAAGACAAVGLDPDELLSRFPHELSGGQRQRLMVARALMMRPRMLIADEPVSMIDASMRASVLGALAELRNRVGLSIIYITHDLATARWISDYVLVMREGRIVEAGRPEEVIGDPQHPYTRLLVDSIPWPDPERAWGTEDAKDAEEAPSRIRSLIDGLTIAVPGAQLDAPRNRVPRDA